MYIFRISTATVFLCFFVLLFSFPAEAQTSSGRPSRALRSLDELFPDLGDMRSEVFSEAGLVRALGKNDAPGPLPASGSGIALHNSILEKRPSYLAVSLMVVPYSGRPLDMLDAYNALGRISDLKGRLYYSNTRRAEIPLFEEATRIQSAQRNTPIPDPQPATLLPSSETIYVRLKEANFGNSYFRADISTSPFGVTYNMTNFRSISYLIFPVMAQEKFSAKLYLEPLTEGMLVYSIGGADLPDIFGAMIDIPSFIANRLVFFTRWISDSLKK